MCVNVIRFSNRITGEEAKDLLRRLSKYCRIVIICDITTGHLFIISIMYHIKTLTQA